MEPEESCRTLISATSICDMWYIIERKCSKGRERSVYGCEIISDKYYDMLRTAAKGGEVCESDIDHMKMDARRVCRKCEYRSPKLIEVEPLSKYHISTPVSECGVPVVETVSGKARVVSVFNLVKFDSESEAKKFFMNSVLEDYVDEMNSREIDRITERILDDPFNEKSVPKDQLTLFDAMADSEKLAMVDEDDLRQRFMEQF